MTAPGLARAVVLGAGGGFGRCFLRLISEAGTSVLGVDGQQCSEGDRWLVADAVHPPPELVTELTRCDLVVLCLPERALFPALVPVLTALQPGTLVVDISSVKTLYASAASTLRDDLELCSLEPMFAPDVGFAGQDLLVARLRAGPRTEAFVRLLRGSGADVSLVSADCIDQQAAVSQVAAHAVVLAYGDALGQLGFDPDGPTTALQRVLLTMVARVCTRDPDVYWHIQHDNPYATRARQVVADSLRALAVQVESGDQRAFTDAVRAAAETLGPALHPYAEHSAAVVAAATKGPR
ncbi:MAG TPA: prephenate dehydrogenase/arogenate dehydrogenase family protein [Propionibacteriaceae bacterium]